MVILMFDVTGCQKVSKVKLPTMDLGIIENRTKYKMKDVKVFHLPTRASLSTSTILPYSRFEIGFAPTELPGETVIVCWSQQDKSYKVTIDVPNIEGTQAAQNMTLLYKLFARGRVNDI